MTQNISDLEERDLSPAEKSKLETLKMATTMVAEFLAETGLDSDPIIKEMMEGQTAAQAMGLTRDELEVLYAAGFNQLNAGEFATAREAFTYLCMIDSLEAKNYYCLGMAHQLEGAPEKAAPVFINFLALDATNPHGYLRYGECLMAQGERSEALDAFRVALAEAEKNDRDPAAAAEARAKIALAEKDA